MRISYLASSGRRRRALFGLLALLAALGALFVGSTSAQASSPSPTFPSSINQAFSEASQRFGVPADLLKAICYKEGRLSQNAGITSQDGASGCMGLVKNSAADTLDQAAKDLNVPVNLLKQSISANIFGGAAVLRDEALGLSATHTLPTSLADWYGAVAQYSSLRLRSTELMYANIVYALIKQGFRAQAMMGETVVLAAQNVTPHTATAAHIRTFSSLPAGCQDDGNVDYPGAIDCILTPPAIYDCNVPTSPDDCNYTSSDRPTSCTVQTTQTQPCNVDQVVIHDTEASLTGTLDVFQCPGTGDTTCRQSSVNYIVDTDGTIYQVVREKDISYHVGNFWYNQHSVGIEHIGYDATGYLWYNSAQYEASAKLTAYLLKKYHIPLDRAHVVAHGTVPSPTLASSPNHVDPGPYWLWDYYFKLISRQGVPFHRGTPVHTITLRPKTDQAPANPNGTETPAQYNFFNLYNGPSTASGLIPQQEVADPTDVSYNVEPEISYFYLAKVKDPAGTGYTMYEIWYGEEDQVHASPSSYVANAKLAWLAVPPGDGVEGHDLLPVSAVIMKPGSNAQIYGRPTGNSGDIIGSAPAGAIFTTSLHLTQDNATTLWYEINFNHRQAWVPASEVVTAANPAH